ncbi:MAG: response regulator transcription factor [Clostridiales bacterium]|nr:response regulator transcription factor [Clostridiales bacterium]
MRILIVEDEIRLAGALQELLTKQKYVTDAVYDGVSGLDYALSDVYDAVILDIMLPKLDGISVLRAMRTQGIHTPVLLLTARDEIADKVSGLDSGADDYLTKPFSTEELLARLRAITRRKGEVQQDGLEFGGLRLDSSTGTLHCGARSVALGRKELQIIELFLKNSGIILTKEQIIEKVWGFDGNAEYNNVEVYISFLRKKLQYLSSPVGIRTVRGMGYLLEEAGRGDD